MADDRRDPDPPRRVGPLKLGPPLGEGDPYAARERARVSVTERVPVERGGVSKSSSSGTIRAIKDRWTPQNIASAAGILVSILATAGITKGCNNEAHTQEMAAEILKKITAVDEKITKEAEARRVNDKAHDLQITDVATLASYLNQGAPADTWPAKSDGWDIPSIGSDRVPRFKVNRGFPDLKDAKDRLENERLREQ